jgi:hypothetical protein
VPSSNFSRNTDCPKVVCGITQVLQVNSKLNKAMPYSFHVLFS